MIASSSSDNIVDLGSRGPVGKSATDGRFFHLATVFWLMRWRFAGPSGSLDYFARRIASCGILSRYSTLMLREVAIAIVKRVKIGMRHFK